MLGGGEVVVVAGVLEPSEDPPPSLLPLGVEPPSWLSFVVALVVTVPSLPSLPPLVPLRPPSRLPLEPLLPPPSEPPLEPEPERLPSLDPL